MPTISYTTVPSTHTVKPTRTPFTNNTGASVTLNFSNGTSLVIANNTTSDRISTTISGINRSATNYYSAHGSNYTIVAGQAATLTMNNNNIDMVIA